MTAYLWRKVAVYWYTSKTFTVVFNKTYSYQQNLSQWNICTCVTNALPNNLWFSLRYIQNASHTCPVTDVPFFLCMSILAAKWEFGIISHSVVCQCWVDIPAITDNDHILVLRTLFTRNETRTLCTAWSGLRIRLKYRKVRKEIKSGWQGFLHCWQ